MDRGFYRCSMMFKDFPLLFIFIFSFSRYGRRGGVLKYASGATVVSLALLIFSLH